MGEIYVVMKGHTAIITAPNKLRVLTLSGCRLIRYGNVELNEGEMKPELTGMLQIIALENLRLQLFLKLG